MILIQWGIEAAIKIEFTHSSLIRFGKPEHQNTLINGDSGDRQIRFQRLPPPTDVEVTQITERIARRVTRLLQRRGLGPDADPEEADSLYREQPLLAELYTASVQGRISTGSQAGNCLAMTIESREMGSKAELRAQVGEAVAYCNVTVSATKEGPNLKIELVPGEAAHRRALVEIEKEQIVIKIMAEHPAIKRYVGPGPDFPYQSRSTSRALMAEIVAGEAVRMVMERKFSSTLGSGLLDAAHLYVEHSKYFSKYLTRCHRYLVADNVLKRNGTSEYVAVSSMDFPPS